METANPRTPLVRAHGIRKQAVATKVPTASKSKIAEEAYTRASGFDNGYFEKMKKTTMSRGPDSNIKGIVLGKLRRNSIHAKKIQDSSAEVCLRLNKNLFKSSPELDLFKESVGSVLNRLSRGDSAFTDEELLTYLSKAFMKSQSETDALVTKLKAENISRHSLQVSIQSANLKHKPKTSTFCSITLLEEGSINFARCDDTNTKLTILCGTQVPLYDLNTTFPLDTALANGCKLVLAVWETKGTADFDIVNNEKRCVGITEVHLDEQPEGGSDDWYEIKSRKNEKEKGTINIVVKFHVDVEHDADFKVQTHIKLLSRFLSCDYEDGAKGLQSTSAYILELHLQQKGLSSDERWLSEWTVRNALYAKTNSDYGMLLGVLNKVLLPLNNGTSRLSPHQKADLITSFDEFIKLALEKYRNLVSMFPYTSPDAITKLQCLNHCIAAIVNCKAYPDITKTKELICEALTQNVQVWYHSYCEEPEEGAEKKKSQNVREKAVKSVTEKIKALNTIAKTIQLEISLEAEVYPLLFKSLGIDFISLTLHEVDNLFSIELVREISGVIKAMKEHDPEEELMNSTLYLYVCVSDIKKQFLSLAQEDEEFTLLQYHSWFYNPIETWIKIIRKKQVMRVCKAVELDKLEFCDDFVRYSTSVIDVETMNIELGDIYKIFDFPDESSAFSVVSKLTDQICDSMVMLSAKLVERAQVLIKTKKSMFGSEDKTEKCKYIQTLCVILNSMGQGSKTFLRLPTIMNFAQFENPKNIATLEKTIVDASNGIDLQKATMLHNLCDLIQPKFDPVFKEYLKRIHSVDENALEELYLMIVDELSMMFEWVDQGIFVKCIASLWSRVIQPRFLQQIDHRPLKKDKFYIGLQAGFINLAEFFIEEVPELKTPILESGEFLHLCNIFKLLTNPIQELLFRFYEEEAAEQGKIKSSALGEVHLSAYFTVPNKNDTTLKVVVKQCAELPKMDISGSCDSIVQVLVQPTGVINFSHIKQRKTNCIKNNLDPVFNHTFEIPLHIDDINLAGACLQLLVWDKDLFTADDLIGEVLIPLRDIPTQLAKDFVCNLQEKSIGSRVETDGV